MSDRQLRLRASREAGVRGEAQEQRPRGQMVHERRAAGEFRLQRSLARLPHVCEESLFFLFA